MQHVNNVVYVQWVQDIASEHWLKRAGKEMLATYDWVMLNHYISYKFPAVKGDEVLIKTQVGSATNAKYQRFVEIRRKSDQKLLAESKTEWCALNKNGRPVRISQELRDIFEVE
jgi:acyl-CoA thioester hydrolase